MALVRIWFNNNHLAPRYVHDCEECIFLGHLGGADVWLHQGAWRDRDEVILRDSSEGAEYSSFPVAVARNAGPCWDDAVLLADNCFDSGYKHDVVEWSEFEDQWAWRNEYEQVVGLYDDFWYKIGEKNAFFRDNNGNPLGIAKLDCVLSRDEDDIFAGSRFQIDINLDGVPESMWFFHPSSRKALFLYVQLLMQLSKDAGQ